MTAAGTTAGPLKRYLFERGFHVEAAPAAPPPPPAATYSADDLARARAAGFAEGRTAGISEAERAGETRHAAAIEAVADALMRSLADRDAIRNAAIGEAIAIAAAIAAKMLPALYRREAASEIEAMVAAVLPNLIEESRITVRVNPDDEPAVSQRLAAIAKKGGFAGRLTVSGDAAFAAGDCRIDWGAGGAERDGERLWREIEAVLAASAPSVAVLVPNGIAASPHPAGSSGDSNHAGGSDG